MKTYSVELREKVIKAGEEGKTIEEIAEIYKVGQTFVKKIRKQQKEEGNILPKPHGGGRQRILHIEERQKLKERVKETVDESLEELRGWIKEEFHKGISISTVSKELQEMRLWNKKTLYASEMKEEERNEYREKIKEYDDNNLIFLDEMEINRALTRRYGRAEGKARAVGTIPRNKGKNHTVISVMGVRGIISSMQIEEGVDSEVFKVFLKDFLVKNIKKEDVVVW